MADNDALSASPAGWRFPAAGRAAQERFDAAVVMVTVLRARLVDAIESVYRQDFAGTIQILIGIDQAQGDIQPLLELLGRRPPNVGALVLDPGYSTAQRHGGLHAASDGGSLRTVLSYLANSERLAYLDDDNRWRPNHLAALSRAIEGFDWAWTQRVFVDERDGRELCVDEWDSCGPGRGLRREELGGFVDVNCLMIDKTRASDVLGLWSQPLTGWKATADRRVFLRLRQHHSVGWTGTPTVQYSIRPTFYLWPRIRERLQAA